MRIPLLLLGAAMAHEIVHMLLPVGSHAESGLMRPQWSTEDLKPRDIAAMGLSPRTLALMRVEALRKASRARANTQPEK